MGQKIIMSALKSVEMHTFGCSFLSSSDRAIEVKTKKVGNNSFTEFLSKIHLSK